MVYADQLPPHAKLNHQLKQQVSRRSADEWLRKMTPLTDLF